MQVISAEREGEAGGEDGAYRTIPRALLHSICMYHGAP